MEREKFRRACAVVGVLAAASPALASFHEWMPDEVYSNASGTVQYIEFSNQFNFENALSGHIISSVATGHQFVFPSSPALPTSTAGHRMLVATPGYAALAGVPAPDFIFPINNFFSISGDTLKIIGTDQPPFVFAAGDLPTDGIHSRTFDGSTYGTGVNTPTNFAGVTGSVPAPDIVPGAVPEPGTLTIALTAAAGLLLRRRRRA